MRASMKPILLAAVLVSLLVAINPQARAAQETDWEAQFRGLDSVVVSCKRTLKTKYTARICKALRSHARAFLKEQAIPHEDLGTWYRDDPRPENPAKLKHPLNLTIYVRSTQPNPLGMDVRVNAEVLLRQARDADQPDSPRTGMLLLWQDGITAAGSRKRLERAIIGALKKKTMTKLFELIKTNWPKVEN